MEMYLPEIALKQPKTDPRTVLLHKRNFLESSSDHIQEEEESHPNKMTHQNRAIYATADECTDRLHQHHTMESRLRSQTSILTTSASSAALDSLEASPVAVSASASASLALSSQTTTSTTTTTTTAPSSSSLQHSTTSVNFYQTCHLYKFASLHYFNDNLNNLYKFQPTKLLVVLLFICCAISSSYLPTTQAIPVRRTTSSGQRLILHSNVYRERYHQNLLQDQRQHRQQQQQQQQQLLQKHHQYQQQLKQQQQPHQQVQRPSSYLAPILRKVHHQLQHHHLHQRAAPAATRAIVANRHKMSYCESQNVFENMKIQIFNSLHYIKQLCEKYLKDREDKTYNEMKETWKLLKLEIRNPTRKPVTFENELQQKMHDFYLNLHNFHQLVEFVYQDTIDNKTSIEHGEDINATIILNFFEKIKKEIKYNIGEAEKVLEGLTIEKPNLDENTVEFNKTITGKIRDFLVIKEFIDEMETISEMIKLNNEVCQSANNGHSSDQEQ